MEILVGLLSFLCSVAVAVGVVSFTFLLFVRCGVADVSQVRGGNRAAGVALGAELVAFGLLLSGCLYPIAAMIQQMILWREPWMGGTGRVLGFAVLNYALAVGVVWLAGKLFQWFTRGINEREEINGRGNVAVALVYGAVVVAVALLVREGLSDLLNTLIPVPGSTPVSLGSI